MIKEGYKETEIGNIPDNWDLVDLNSLGEIITGNTPKTSEPENYGNEFCFVSPADMGNNKYILDTIKKVSKVGFEKTRKLPKGSILVTCIGSTIGKIGILSGEGCSNQQINSIICKNKINNEYVYYSINQYFDKYTPYISTQAVPIINKSVFSKLKIPLATLGEQQRISEILSTTDAHIEKLDKAIEDYKLLKKGMMKKLLTEGIGHTEFKETEIGRIPKEWEAKSLGSVSTIIAGQSPSSDTYNEGGVGVPFYQGKTEFGRMYPATRKWCSEPIKIAAALDILISVRAPVGDVNICEIKSCIGRGLGIIRESNDSNYLYLYYLMQYSHDRLNKVGQGSTFTAINTSDLKNFIVQVPSLEEQCQIAEVLFETDGRIELFEREKDDFMQLKKSLMEKLLTGKIRTTEIRSLEV